MIPKQDLKKVFSLCDENSKGFLTLKELSNALSGVLGFSPILNNESHETTLIGAFINIVHKHYSNPETRDERRQDLIRQSFLALDTKCLRDLNSYFQI
jgi:Ca2+-binding EF-hand superfamily protein